jgi:hypothetical protein
VPLLSVSVMFFTVSSFDLPRTVKVPLASLPLTDVIVNVAVGKFDTSKKSAEDKWPTSF